VNASDGEAIIGSGWPRRIDDIAPLDGAVKRGSAQLSWSVE